MSNKTPEEQIMLLEQDFKNHKEQYDAICNRIDDLDKRVKAIELSKQKTDYQYEQIMDSLKTLNEKTIPKLTAQIEELKNKPVKRYDQAVSSVLGAIFGAAGAWLASKMFGN